MTGSVKQQLELKKKTLTQKQLRLNNFSVGNKGEQKAIKFLIELNYLILEKNLRLKNNEVDIVAYDKNFDEIVFVEVKTRKNNFFGNPGVAVTRKKLNSMNLVAKRYLKSKGYNKNFRFDIIAIHYFEGLLGQPENRSRQPKIEHFENITWPN